MGKGAPKIKASPMEQIMAQNAAQQQARTTALQGSWEDPLRGLMQPQIMQALNTNPFSTSLNAADRHTLEAQFGQARKNVMNTALRGGQMNSELAGLERDRAQAIAGAANQARQLGIGRALQAAGGALPNQQSTLALQGQANAGVNSVMGQQNQRNLAQSQANAQSDQGKGQLAGKGLMALAMM